MRFKHVHRLVRSAEEYREIDEATKATSEVGFDIETDGLRWWGGCAPVGLGFGVVGDGEIRTWYVPQAEEEQVPRELAVLLDDSSVAKIGANIRFDVHFMRAQGVQVHNLDDVQVLARLVRTGFQRVALDKLIAAEFDSIHRSWEALIVYGRKQKLGITHSVVPEGAYRKVPSEILGLYCGEDVYWTLLLWKRYQAELEKDPRLKLLYERVERPLVEVVTDMEEVGIRVDRAYLAKLKEKLAALKDHLQAQVFDTAGKVFDIDSVQQTGAVLKEHGVQPEMRRRKKNEVIETPSMDKRVLEKRADVPIVDMVLRYRAVRQLLSTFVEAILERATPDGRLYTSIRQEAARTERLSAADPNLMNLPRADKEDDFRREYSIRRAVLPLSKESILLSIDFDQIELRLLAHFSKEPAMLEAYRTGVDLHGLTASKLYQKAITDVTKPERTIGKKFNFAQTYGAGKEALAEQCRIHISEVYDLLASYDEAFPGISAFKHSVEVAARRHGGIRNPFGRWRELPLNQCYRAVNTLIQGTAADLLKIALLRLHRFLRGKKSKMLFPVHDEVVVDYRFEDGPIVQGMVDLMTKFETKGKPLFVVPIEVSVAICRDNWAEKRDIDVLEIVEAGLQEVKT